MNRDRKANYTFVMDRLPIHNNRKAFYYQVFIHWRGNALQELQALCSFFPVEFGRSVKCRFWPGLSFRYRWDLDLWVEIAAAVFWKCWLRIVKPWATNICISGKAGGGWDRGNSLLLVERGEGNCAGSGTRKFWRQEGMQPNKSWKVGVGSKFEPISFMGHW